MEEVKKKFTFKFKKLLTKINVFEILLVILVLLGLVFLMDRTRTSSQWTKVRVKVSSPSWWQGNYIAPPYWLGDSLAVGDKDYDSQGRLAAEILNVQKYEFSIITLQDPTRRDVYLYLNMLVSENRKTGKMTFKNKTLEVGGPVELHFNGSLVGGLVTYIDGKNKKGVERELIIEGVWPNTYTWNADAITVGQQAKDEVGNIVAEVLDRRVELAARTAETAEGGLVAGRDPWRRDVYLKIKLKVLDMGNSFYYAYDKKVKIGEQLFIAFPNIDVKWFGVTGIFEPNGKQIF